MSGDVTQSRALDAALQSLDNSRRVGWAKAYAAEAEIKELRARYDVLTDLAVFMPPIVADLIDGGAQDVAAWFCRQEIGRRIDLIRAARERMRAAGPYWLTAGSEAIIEAFHEGRDAENTKTSQEGT